MIIYLDKYGILINGRASEGFLTFSHPDLQSPIQVKKHPDYEGPVPQVHNTLCVTCHNNIPSKLSMIWQFTKWLFSNEFKQKASTPHNE